jgi:hypothetical protein
MRLLNKTALGAAMLAAVLGTSVPAFANARIVIMNFDGPNEGFNDPTPVTPLANNPGRTLGERRMIAVRYAASIWEQMLDSAAEIRILASFDPLTCNAGGATLAAAGATHRFSDFGSLPPFAGPVAPNMWHHAALADKLFGADLVPSDPSFPFGPFPDIQVIFNLSLDAGCFNAGFYYGLDENEPANQTNIIATALHEMGHGLGFSQFANTSTGVQTLNLPDVYNRFLFDSTAGKTWPEMTNAERAASAINPRKVVWNGPEVITAAPTVLQHGTPVLTIGAPAAIAGTYQIGSAGFGTQLTLDTPPITAQVVQALDEANATGPTTFDACTPLTNASQVTGKIAIVDRGTCGFIVKVKNAQDAGALAVIVADNAAGSPPAGLGGADPTIVITSVRVTQADGNLIKANLAGGVAATLGLDTSLLAGADATGRVYLNSPNPLVPGSSISHFDPLAFPNLIMEPAINTDLPHSVRAPRDLTLELFRDIGWYADADVDGFADDRDSCPTAFDTRATVVVAGSDTAVPNVFLTSGCTVQDLLNRAEANAENHGDFVSEVTHVVNALRDAGIIDNTQRKAIHGAASASRAGQ